MQTQHDTSEYQRKVSDFVGREVIYCVSSLIHDLTKNDAGEYWDYILSICVQDDYETPAFDEGWKIDECGLSGNRFGAYKDDNMRDDYDHELDAISEPGAWREVHSRIVRRIAPRWQRLPSGYRTWRYRSPTSPVR